MSFKEWMKLQEVGTSTSSVAGFARIAIPMVRRQFMPHWGEGDPFFTKKKKKEIFKERTEQKRASRAWIQSYLAQTPPTFEYSKEHFEEKGETVARTDYEGACKKIAMKPQYRKETLKEDSMILKLKSSQDEWKKLIT